jgi:hypothetical protein
MKTIKCAGCGSEISPLRLTCSVCDKPVDAAQQAYEHGVSSLGLTLSVALVCGFFGGLLIGLLLSALPLTHKATVAAPEGYEWVDRDGRHIGKSRPTEGSENLIWVSGVLVVAAFVTYGTFAIPRAGLKHTCWG